jgi:hypothetical protein
MSEQLILPEIPNETQAHMQGILAGELGDVMLANNVILNEVPDENPSDYLARKFPTEYGALQDAKAEAEVRTLDEFISTRTREALRSSEFQETPELRESIAGFYEDHYYLAAAIRSVTEGDYEAGVFTRILDNPKIMLWEKNLGSKLLHEGDSGTMPSPNVVVASYRIAKMVEDFTRTRTVLSPEQAKERQFNILKQCGVALNDMLFNETSVGITTIGETEVATAKELAASLQNLAGGRLINDVYNRRISFNSPQDVEGNIRRSIDTFWSDTRQAGQLEFHASPTMGSINQAGLMSRNQQVRTTGAMNAQTMVQIGTSGYMHSVVPHFSEFYGGGAYSQGEEGSSVAIPLINVIRVAPYARDAKYGLLVPKNDSVIERVPQPTALSPVDSINAGRSDRVGNQGPDRVFFASPDERSDKLPDDYIIQLHDKNKRPPAYIINRNLDDETGRRELRLLGLGYGAPERLIIEKGQSAEGSIKELQELYIRENAHYGIVVPMRRGVFAQNFENVNVDDKHGRSDANIYNKYSYGTEKRVA